MALLTNASQTGAARRLGGAGDGPDRSLAQGDPEEMFTKRVPSPAEVVMSAE